MRPNRIVADVPGELTWDSENSWWQGQAQMADVTPFQPRVYSLAYSTQFPTQDDATIDRRNTQESRNALALVCKSDGVIRAAVAQEFEPLFSDWNDVNTIETSEFQRRLRLESVALTPKGQAEVYFGDDGMFAGHALIALFDPDGVVRYIELCG